ncbi:transposase [Pseudidiomarina sp.]|uniref:transposase n=1 Tax=Pseudidiomarina sp. TaxID=2081707 RepID=UPI003A96F25D
MADEDFAVYLHWLHQYADETGYRLHAYALMTNHVHLLVSADRAQAPGALMKALGQRLCSISIVRIGVAAPCGRAATVLAWSRLRIICWSANVTLS